MHFVTSYGLSFFFSLFHLCIYLFFSYLLPNENILGATSKKFPLPSLKYSYSDLQYVSSCTDTEIPIACAIIIPLFVLQHYGTHKIGFLFAPIIIVWLLFISGLGIYNIFHWDRYVIAALSPRYMFKLLQNLNIINWRSLGGVLLCTAGTVYNSSHYHLIKLQSRSWRFNLQGLRQCLQI